MPALFVLIFGLFIVTNIHISDERSKITTAIADNGCSKPAKIELSQTKTNADVYNYAALSTSYKRN